MKGACAVTQRPIQDGIFLLARWWPIAVLLALCCACAAPATDSTTPRLALAAAYYENGQYRIALDEVQKILRIQPEAGPANALQGLIYVGLKEPSLAEQSFLRAEKQAPGDADIAHNHGLFLCEQNQYDRAFERFAMALRQPLYADKAKTYWVWGFCAQKSGDLAGAQDLWRQSLADQLSPAPAVALAQSYQSQKRNPQALLALREVNLSQVATAESLWLGVQLARKTNDALTLRHCATLLQTRFPASSQWDAFQREAFDD
jgi:type IV pilus assembly protein PilF